ncbi:MAG: ferrochelatase, partial [Alphaproteobacteria bacterium]|nr:ferrochelatase [Alphaproteobacteria bacterium]
MTQKQRTAIVLFNLGGPDSPAAIAPFLKNFFMDPLILRVPYPARFFLSRLIAFRRSRKEAGQSYAALGGSSPLLANSRAQADALQATLNADNSDTEYRSFVCMRYWHPLSPEIAAQVKAWNPDRVVLLPLYPQYSTTTTESSFRAWDEACRKISYAPPTARICCYPEDKGFITESANRVRAAY